ncbi:toprim domain-containing protein [[Eubacterium] cellulosolvens]
MTIEEKHKKVVKLTERLIKKSQIGIPIIVEGPNDVKSLRRLGFEGEIFCLKNCQIGFYDFIDKFRKEKELIIMTDFDKEGRELSRNLMRELSSMKINTNISMREQMEGLMKNDIKAIEELAEYIHKVKSTS